ncbi:MAG: hypothetical protein HRT44_03810 [Bdellovibrionales bacterium]|nr:hypothetical protein [Bdellovibrionales bacterium]NQZ18369.1 hypothetical protein [Bdellovibrionales bacterium]
MFLVVPNLSIADQSSIVLPGQSETTSEGVALFGSSSRSSGGSCIARSIAQIVRTCGGPLAYRLGGRPTLSSGTVTLNNDVDCTGLPSAALAMCGLRAQPSWYAFTTSSISGSR